MIKYVILHWTGVNTYNVTTQILNSYQLVIDANGNTHQGKPIGQTSSTGGMNSITYNISCCGGGVNAPMTKSQCEQMFKETAKILKKYNLTTRQVFTHHIIGEMCRNKTIVSLLPYNKYLAQNIGKIDLTKLPYDIPKDISYMTFIRQKIQWYYNQLGE